MYAVVATGGKQLKVENGAVAVVEKIDAPVGESVTLPVLFVADGDTILFGDDAAAVTVTATVVEHFKGDKQIVFKFKKRKGYKKMRGHRQQQTTVLITDIATGAPKKAAKAVKAEAPVVEAAVATEKPAVKKPAAEKPAVKKPAAKKPAAKVETAAAEKPAVKKPAAKKPAAKKPAAAKAVEGEVKKPAAKKPAAKKPASNADEAAE
ncbi:MAG: large subunit ribosomal protein [Actinobacteria bacterium]|nr:MAG: large subunit ribosomal protein [Actinomycetota bacterium]